MLDGGDGATVKMQNALPTRRWSFGRRWHNENGDEVATAVTMAGEEVQVCDGDGKATTLEGNRGEHRPNDGTGDHVERLGETRR